MAGAHRLWRRRLLLCLERRQILLPVPVDHRHLREPFPVPGIDRTHLPRLAERFYRVEGQKSGERLGTGLGLAIVKHIVNRHRGGLMVESAPGHGSAFIAYFPMIAAAAPVDDPAGPADRSPP